MLYRQFHQDPGDREGKTQLARDFLKRNGRGQEKDDPQEVTNTFPISHPVLIPAKTCLLA